MTSSSSTSQTYLLLFRLHQICMQLRSRMIRNRTPDHNSERSATMTFDNALWKAAFNGIASKTNAAIMVQKIKAGFIKKDNLLQIGPPGSVFISPLLSQPSMICREGLSCIMESLPAIHAAANSRRRRNDEADINTPVSVDHRSANCLEEVVRSVTAMRTRCLSSRADVAFRRPLPVFGVVRRSSVHCFQTRSLWYCSAAHELIFHDRKILLHVRR